MITIKFLIDLKLTHEKISGYVSDYLKPENFLFVNNSKEKAELFSISSEVTESSR